MTARVAAVLVGALAGVALAMHALDRYTTTRHGLPRRWEP